jgi:hypothetical protein
VFQLLLITAISGVALCSCAPQREYVAFGDVGTFHPGPRYSSEEFSDADTEYDSYELVDNGRSPNHGIPPMYGGDITDMVKEVRRSQFPMMPRCITMDGMEGKVGIQEPSKHMTNTETLAP